MNASAPYKTKIFRGNNKPHISKELRKAIMHRSYLKNKFLLVKTEKSFSQYKTQRNLVTKLNEKEKKTFFGKIEAGNFFIYFFINERKNYIWQHKHTKKLNI